MARHLLDSDVLIWVLRGKPEAVDFVRSLLKEEIPAISALAFYEIGSGARAAEEAAISAFLSSFNVCPVDQEIATRGGNYYRMYRKKGMTLSVSDALIAATAGTRGLVLVTQNARHFPMTDIEKRSL